MKSFEIDKGLVSGAWEKVRANKDAPGVDATNLAAFEEQASGNIYKLWNRMSSGSYFPGPVRTVPISDHQGPGGRVLGVPNTVDRVAQTAAVMLLEGRLAPLLHPDPGCAPGGPTGGSRWQGKHWAIHLEGEDFFDHVPHDQLLKAVSAYTGERWVSLYIERWLQAPLQMPDGTLADRKRGTPQGSPISPPLADLFMRDAFDGWMEREHPSCPFERHAADVLVHCESEAEAREVLAHIVERFGTLGVELHPDPTRVVSAIAGNRPDNQDEVGVDHTLRDRLAKGFQDHFGGGVPAIGARAGKAISQKIRAGQLNRRSTQDPSAPAGGIDRAVRGLIDNYGRFKRSDLTRWAKKGRKNR